MQKLTLKAPAKLNLYLKVLKKRPDGYHDIETIFEKIDLCDKITLRKRKRDIRVLSQARDIPKDKRNLCFKAAQALLKEAHLDAGAEIRINKRIPVACGLGGGSSDAASVLLGLNRLLSLGFSQDKLLQIGALLGADVPFFLLPHSRALGEGKGERLLPLRIRKRHWYVLVWPRLKVSTHKMYQHPKITLTKGPCDVRIVSRALEKGDLTALNKRTFNSFESILTKKYKQILEIKKALSSSGACATMMSGSGPCIFGVIKTRKEAQDIGKRLKARGNAWQVIVTKTYANSKEEE
jgi:4-diphosphocytidyl-2-C-methyl-D-erythritol kinase